MTAISTSDTRQRGIAPRFRAARMLGASISIFVAFSQAACEFDASSPANPVGELASPNAHGCACECVASQEVPAEVSAGTDDAAEAVDGTVTVDASNLVLAQAAADPTLVGLRFAGVDLSSAAEIEQAYVQFTTGSGNAPPGASFGLAVASGGDDANEHSDNSVTLSATSLAFQPGEIVALRFTGVFIPANAFVLSAHVQFTAASSMTGATTINISGEASGAAAPLLALAGNLSGRLRTTASVQWLPPEWTIGEAGAPEHSVDLGEVIEEISSQAGWVPGNALVLFFETAAGGRLASSFEGGAAATLEITLGNPPQPVSIEISGEATDDAAPFANVVFDLSSRGRTASSVTWEPGAWMDSENGLEQRTPDLSEVIEAILQEPGWAAGNALALFFEDATTGGDRIASAFDGAAASAARLVVVALDPDNPQLEFELSVCMPDDLNPNVDDNDFPTSEELAADCEERVTDNVRGLAAACGYTEDCDCIAVDLPNEMETAYDRSCSTGCVGEALEDDCSNFDPDNGSKTATHLAGDEPVCLTASSDPPELPASALADPLFGQRSQCELAGNAEIFIDGLDDRFPDLTARLYVAGTPCPGGACAVTTSYMGAVDSISYDGGFLGAGDTTISEIAVSGASNPEAVVVDAFGDGEIPAGETATSGRGRRQTNRVIKDDIDVRESFIGENLSAIAIGVNWDAATCFLEGPLFGGVITDSDPDEDEDATQSDTVINVVADGVLVNQPPSAVASAPAVVECTSPAGALVALNGGGSADPDDNIAVARWNVDSRVGQTVGFAANVGVPQGLGTTLSYVHRVVDGFGQAAQDAVSVSVVDTTAPNLFAPQDLEVECAGPAGTPVYLGRAFADDVCDADVEISNDAPAVFPVGNTAVVWTATDDTGNQTMHTQNVLVVDTTPPELAVELDPETLWPPNHKMRSIEATIEVFDVCDPNPTVELVSIVSDEPDDDIADGATTGDIQGAAFGTDDRDFQLRCERQGKGDGRVYGVTYRASDASDNTTDETDEVSVAKSQGGAG